MKRTPAEAEAAAKQAIEHLAARGIPIDGDLWSDPDKFDKLLGEAEKILGCDLEAPRVQALVVNDGQSSCYGDDFKQLPNLNYCGPGCGHAWTDGTPQTTEVLNRTCYEHDRCYDKLEQARGKPIPRSCYWSRITDSCDVQMLRVCEVLKNSNRIGDEIDPTDRTVCELAFNIYLANHMNPSCWEDPPDAGAGDDGRPTTPPPIDVGRCYDSPIVLDYCKSEKLPPFQVECWPPDPIPSGCVKSSVFNTLGLLCCDRSFGKMK